MVNDRHVDRGNVSLLRKRCKPAQGYLALCPAVLPMHMVREVPIDWPIRKAHRLLKFHDGNRKLMIRYSARAETKEQGRHRGRTQGF